MARLRRGSSALIRDLNRAAILTLIGEEGAIARVEIARRLALSPAAVTEITRELVADGIVQEVDQAPSSGGRPPIRLALVGTAAQAIGLKVAPDHLATVRARLDGEVLGHETEPFEASAPNVADRLLARLRQVIDETDQTSSPLLGVGLGVPGVVDDGGVVSAPSVGWHRLELGSFLRSRLGVPVLIDNDVNTLAVAERLYGRGRGVDHFITVTIGRGVGLGIVVSGDVYRGARGGAGEFGHVPVADEGPACSCGRHGCLEALIADPALAREAVAAGLVRADSPDAVADLRRAAETGNATARAIYARAGATLGRAVGGLVNVLSPQLILISGEGTEAWPHMAGAFDEALRRALFAPLGDVQVETDPWDDVKWARGAAALVFRAALGASLYERQLDIDVRTRLEQLAVDAGDGSGAGVLATGGSPMAGGDDATDSWRQDRVRPRPRAAESGRASPRTG